MNLSRVQQIADAVLYEGYLLYPYRTSAVKNQQRWNFGVLTPKSYSDAQHGTESSTMQTECIIESNPGTSLDVRARFLQLVRRDEARVIADCRLPPGECGHHEIKYSGSALHCSGVPSLDVNGQRFPTRQEAIEREVHLSGLGLVELGAESYRQSFSFPQSETIELVVDENSGETVGVILRSQQEIEGVIEVQISDLRFLPEELVDAWANGVNPQTAIGNRPSPLKVTVRILNLTPFANAEHQSRDQALMRSFVSTHTILGVHDGEFVSLLDPPEALRQAVGRCKNAGTYPVLAGEEGVRDCMLSSPIILYDYPQIAPESAGELFDGTEIDEILTLRIMTLTDAEKEEIRHGDERARRILRRTETMVPEQLMKLHGVLRRPRAFGDEPA
jgi:hypothetical protein